MKTTILILLMAFGMKAQIDDKTLHEFAGSLVCGLVGSSADFVGIRPFKSCLLGVGAGCLAGVGKEVYDLKVKKTKFDKYDMYATFWGSVCGGVFVRIYIAEQDKKQINKELFENL